MKNLENQISNLLKEIEIMIKNGEKSNIDAKRKELDLLLQEYLKDFKQNLNSIQYKYNSFIQFKNFDNISKKVRWYKLEKQVQ